MKLEGGLENFDTRLGARLKELRTSRGLSLPDVADEIGISYQQMQKYEAGRNSLSVKRMLKIADLMVVDARLILESVVTEGTIEGLAGLEPFQCNGERHRVLKAYFSLPEDIRLAFLGLVEEVCGQMSRKQ